MSIENVFANLRTPAECYVYRKCSITIPTRTLPSTTSELTLPLSESGLEDSQDFVVSVVSIPYWFD